MIVKAEYLRTHYTGANATTDGTGDVCLNGAVAQVEAMIGQPVERREVSWHFTGTGRNSVVLPFTINPGTIELYEKVEFGADWTEVETFEYRRPSLYVSNQFVRERPYKVVLNTGLAAVVNPALVTADYDDYADLVAVVCEIAEMRFYASAQSNTKVQRSGIDAHTSADQGITTDTIKLTDKDRLIESWKKRVARYRRLRTL